MDTIPAYVGWRACTAIPLSGISFLKGSSKTRATVLAKFNTLSKENV
jgi:hypothetical protein